MPIIVDKIKKVGRPRGAVEIEGDSECEELGEEILKPID